MNQVLLRSRKKAAHRARHIIILAILLVLLGGTFSAPARAAVPTYVVEFELNTKFERSLEHFLIDLFNTLQKREEDFTAAFELQKIMKAREDMAKLFQETQEELQDFGQAFDLEKIGAEDRRLEIGADVGNNPLFISPVKGNRIITDPLEYIYGEPMLSGRIVAACSLNYVIWDQEGRRLYDPTLVPDITRLKASSRNKITEALRDGEKKSSFALDANNNGIIDPPETRMSVNNVKRVKALALTGLRYGNWPQYGSGAGSLASEDPVYVKDSVSLLFSSNEWPNAYKRCNSFMQMLRQETPATALIAVMDGLGSVQLTGDDPNSPGVTTAAQQAFMIRSLLDQPPLHRSLVGVRNASYAELSLVFGTDEVIISIQDLSTAVFNRANAVIEQVRNIRELSFVAGQGIRPENLFLTQTENYDCPPNFPPGICAGEGFPLILRIDLNTEYVISPAVILLQKMQAATQATFDLAGQGFLYLDAEETPGEILGAYNLATSGFEDRKICNNAGACALLDPWLKPAADFRSVATIGLGRSPSGTLNIPLQIGPSSDDILTSTNESLAGTGSGLPAPWEDEGSYVNIANEKAGIGSNSPRRYTIARFLVSGGGEDEFDPGSDALHPDNIGIKHPGFDYPINDWYDRVFELYEAGIGALRTDDDASSRTSKRRQFTPLDWECYIALWFFEKPIGVQPGLDFDLGLFNDLETHC